MTITANDLSEWQKWNTAAARFYPSAFIHLLLSICFYPSAFVPIKKPGPAMNTAIIIFTLFAREEKKITGMIIEAAVGRRWPVHMMLLLLLERMVVSPQRPVVARKVVKIRAHRAVANENTAASFLYLRLQPALKGRARGGGGLHLLLFIIYMLIIYVYIGRLLDNWGWRICRLWLRKWWGVGAWRWGGGEKKETREAALVFSLFLFRTAVRDWADRGGGRGGGGG